MRPFAEELRRFVIILAVERPLRGLNESALAQQSLQASSTCTVLMVLFARGSAHEGHCTASGSRLSPTFVCVCSHVLSVGPITGQCAGSDKLDWFTFAENK